MSPELHRLLAVDRLGPDGLDLTVEASAAECAALAERMQVPAVLALSCHYHLVRPVAGCITAHGRLHGRVVRTSVVSLEDFETAVEEDFTVRFVPAGEESDQIDPESDDEIPFRAGMLDLGEATAEQLGLALDPYPRRPGEELPDSDPGLATSPFAALATRRH